MEEVTAQQEGKEDERKEGKGRDEGQEEKASIS